ncbi:hypothetical protein [Methermicoccus shengliensis]|uniref:Uncharacterized protein n=2 Tax=Methermicoccus shengliensis TaxID=660064 RepID=A0A832RWZ5_9EURY|nr:MAG: hypothetical protein XD46_1192 [Euryarchaeota archaeon 55_53]KUK29798.1 MAG: hypothetical protein XD62_1112 [Methanosarcinales archeaon 56_1174]MDI3488386.1 hypothetical protein [Methanosarcinales archaeon]MDN5295050.1 hypothetical protein [Methanosarcinales archaeon]HIH69074.1 hypothetical protein [Methermicoccus shengliensis]
MVKVIERIKEVIGVGRVHVDRHTIELNIQSIEDVKKFIVLMKDHVILKKPHLEILQKYISIVESKNHLKREGFIEILKLIKELRKVNRVVRGNEKHDIDEIIRSMRV